MNIRLATLTTAVVAASVVGTATATAAPDAPVPGVGYHADIDGAAVVTKLTDGSFALSADQQSVAVRDAAGRTVDSLPLSFSLDGQRLPLAQQIADDGRTLRLLPDLTNFDRAAVKPVASPIENQLAMNDLINSVSLGTSVGSLVGTAIGAVAGIGIGIAVAGAACVAISLGCVVTALPIVSLVAAAGGLTGLILAGGPTAIAAALEYYSVMRAEPGTSKYAQYAQYAQGKPADAAPAK